MRVFFCVLEIVGEFGVAIEQFIVLAHVSLCV